MDLIFGLYFIGIGFLLVYYAKLIIENKKLRVENAYLKGEYKIQIDENQIPENIVILNNHFMSAKPEYGIRTETGKVIKIEYKPPYIYVGLYEHEQKCEAENTQKIAQANESYEREGNGTRVLRLASLVWTSEGLPSEWDGTRKPDHAYLFQ